jgi:hypothetical protein
VPETVSPGWAMIVAGIPKHVGIAAATVVAEGSVVPC